MNQATTVFPYNAVLKYLSLAFTGPSFPRAVTMALEAPPYLHGYENPSHPRPRSDQHMQEAFFQHSSFPPQ